MAYYYVCPDCGSHLDPGETCDCKKRQPEEEHSKIVFGGDLNYGGHIAAAGRALPRNGDRAVRVG